jgi:hypothetical protein
MIRPRHRAQRTIIARTVEASGWDIIWLQQTMR